MPNLDRNDIPHWADPAAYDRFADDERLPDAPGDGSHEHDLAVCEHYAAGDEIGWLCGRLPMFTARSAAGG